MDRARGSPALWTAPKGIKYADWRKDFGLYCWYHEDGTPRTFSELDNGWKELYDTVTASTDMRFHNKTIDIEQLEWFTSEFLYQVPYSWIKFKTTIEYYFGALTGKEMGTDFFKDVVNRWLTHEGGRGVDASGTNETSANSTGSNNNKWNTTYGQQQNTSKGRSIAYNQGVQKYAGTELRNENIGELGRDYASGFTDNVGINMIDSRVDNGTSDTNTKSDGKVTGKNTAKSQMAEKYTDHETTDKIQYYPLLNYLKTRVEDLPRIQTFDRELLKLFRHIDSFQYFF